MNINRILIYGFLVLVLPTIVYALDTTHTHPLVTDEIAILIKDTDVTNKYYQELYEVYPGTTTRIYWGTDLDTTALQRSNLSETDYYQKDELVPYGTSFSGKNGGYDNVIDGVVQEDVPQTKVLDHFYQALSGIGLTQSLLPTNLPSPQRAMTFFNEAVDRMSGYSESAKKTGYFELGQALHHVEDMSSPAHVHNDPHLVIDPKEKDDYEAWYLPQMKRIDKMGAQLAPFFTNAVTVQAISNPWVDIWGKTNGSSLVRTVHERTLYQGSLAFPSDVVDQVTFDITGEAVVITGAMRPPDPTGELAEMFPLCPEGDFEATFCLYWVEEAPDVLAHWVIRGVGDFHHQFVNYANPDDWWAVELEVDPNASGGINQMVAYQGKFYIEQLSKDNDSANPLGTTVVPVAMRQNFSQPWNAGSNQTQPNSQSLLEIYGVNLLPLATEIGAGFTEYWYDVANTPPYLKSVTAKQKPNAATAEKVVYYGSWSDIETETYDAHVDVDNCFIFDTICTSKQRQYNEVTERNFAFDLTKISHIDTNEDLKIELEFNEPIKQISLLRLGEFNAQGACVDINGACLEKTNPLPFLISDDEKTWTIKLLKAELSGLGGKLKLTVKAQDKNKHSDGDGGTLGADLDETPATPARRNTTFAKQSIASLTPNNYYPWYQADGENDSDEEIAYSYDYAEGDQNHVLVFDTTGPTTTISIKLTLD